LRGIADGLHKEAHLAVVEVGRVMQGNSVTVDHLRVEPAGAAVVARREDRVARQQRAGPGPAAFVDYLGVDHFVVVHFSLRG